MKNLHKFISSHFKPNCILNNQEKIHNFVNNILSEFSFQILNILAQIAHNYEHKSIHIEDYHLAQKLLKNNKININVVFKVNKSHIGGNKNQNKNQNKNKKYYNDLQNTMINIVDDATDLYVQLGGTKQLDLQYSTFIKHELKNIDPKMKITDETIYEIQQQSVEILKQFNFMFEEYCKRLHKKELDMKDVYDILHFI
jgi:TATA-box binding protein (TBP) (component of TFIID and TFIIIB)